MQLLHSSISKLIIVQSQHSPILASTAAGKQKTQPNATETKLSRTITMAFMTDIHRVEAGIVARLRTALLQARVNFAKNREFHRTFKELNCLTQRELDDLGIHRSNIAEVAHNAVFNR